ncbi:MAG TPA: DUF1801 domain-containing protein [Anaerolineaceae bacterium]
MLPIYEVERFLQFTPPGLRDVVLELRNLVAAVEPAAAEILHPSWISYYHTGHGGPVSAGICQINLHADHIRLSFIHGAFLPDPLGLLIGSASYKKYVKIYSYEDAPWEALEELIRASASFDPRTLSSRA